MTSLSRCVRMNVFWGTQNFQIPYTMRGIRKLCENKIKSWDFFGGGMDPTPCVRAILRLLLNIWFHQLCFICKKKKNLFIYHRTKARYMRQARQ